MSAGLAALGAQLDPVFSGDPRFAELTHSDNQRFEVRPDAFVFPSTASDVVEAIQSAVTARLEVSCRSGGHCGQDFVGSPRRDLVLDLCRLTDVTRAVSGPGVRVSSGATVGHVQKALFRQWGATLPLGACMAVGMGGLVAGGGYGPLSRRLGLVADHLSAVEVAVVDENRTVRLVTARSEDDGDLGDLFWAHTGGGGGNFGVVTAYQFCSPEHLAATEIGLPAAAAGVNVQKVLYPWAMVDEAGFCTLVRRFFAWHERHQEAGTPEASVFATFFLRHSSTPFLELMVQSDVDMDPDGSVLAAFVGSLTEGTNMSGISRGGVMTFLTGTRYMSQADCGDVMGARSASKSAYHRAAPSTDQIAVLHRHLTSPHPGQASYVMLNSYGGEINQRARTATASPQRDSIAKSSWFTAWLDPGLDELHLGWLRELYEEFFAATGGVPISNAATDGCYINYPDLDTRDPQRNRSASPWHELYYGPNYARLQRVKRTWDPLDIFHHSMSIDLGEA